MSSERNTRLWDYLKAITQTKDRSIFEDVDFDKNYEPFIIHRMLLQHRDAVMAANLMNERPWLDKKLQAMFLLNTLCACFRRNEKSLKITVPNDVRDVAEYYDCSLRAARDIVPLHTKEQMKIIRSRLEKGGTATKAGSRHDDS
jgi:hypothetical protein